MAQKETRCGTKKNGCGKNTGCGKKKTLDGTADENKLGTVSASNPGEHFWSRVDVAMVLYSHCMYKNIRKGFKIICKADF